VQTKQHNHERSYRWDHACTASVPLEGVTMPVLPFCPFRPNGLVRGILQRDRTSGSAASSGAHDYAHRHLRAVQVSAMGVAGGAREVRARFIGAVAHFAHDERGQDLVEWTIGLPVFMILCVGIVFYAWMWWNQVVAAGAVHDGTYLAALRGGDVSAGYARTQQMLRSAVGAFASSYSVTIGSDAARRSVSGTVRNNSLFSLPYLGALPLNIQARSFQRLERFYGGPPQGWW
jgi:hypothetical protein